MFVNDRISDEASSIAFASKTLNPNVNVKALSLVIASSPQTRGVAGLFRMPGQPDHDT